MGGRAVVCLAKREIGRSWTILLGPYWRYSDCRSHMDFRRVCTLSSRCHASKLCNNTCGAKRIHLKD
jgi:hypothetical protein